jgi:hypothetical protein
MAPRHIWKACLLTAVLLLAPGVAADDSSNAEDGSAAQSTEGPCDVVVWGLEYPYVDLHPECLPTVP